MGRLVLFVALLFPLAAFAEQPGMEGMPADDIVVPQLHRHVISSDSKPASDDDSAPVARARTPVRKTARHAVKAKKSTSDLSLLVPDLPTDATGDAAPDDAPAASAAAADASDSDGSAAARVAALAGSATRTPAPVSTESLSAEPDIAVPTRRPVVRRAPVTDEPSAEPSAEPSSETPTETLQATEPVAPRAPEPALTEPAEEPQVPAAALSNGPEPMRNLRLGAGLAMVGLMGVNLVMTQFDHSDHFLGADTGRFAGAHHDTEYATFGGVGMLSLVELLGEDSHSLTHKLAFATALAATAAQAGLLFATDARVGYADQVSYSRAHLAASWTAAAAMAVSSVALAF